VIEFGHQGKGWSELQFVNAYISQVVLLKCLHCLAVSAVDSLSDNKDNKLEVARRRTGWGMKVRSVFFW
jgi:hypothetical protein